MNGICGNTALIGYEPRPFCFLLFRKGCSTFYRQRSLIDGDVSYMAMALEKKGMKTKTVRTSWLNTPHVRPRNAYRGKPRHYKIKKKKKTKKTIRPAVFIYFKTSGMFSSSVNQNAYNIYTTGNDRREASAILLASSLPFSIVYAALKRATDADQLYSRPTLLLLSSFLTRATLRTKGGVGASLLSLQ